MSGEILVSSKATARLVVSVPPEPGRLADALAAEIASEYVVPTRTDAFSYLASLACERFSVMIPFIDSVGTEWAAELFEATKAAERLLVLRDASQLLSCGAAGRWVEAGATRIIDYGGANLANETFPAKIVLADGVAAYVGSANLLKRSKPTNLECGMLVEGPAVGAVLLDAVPTIAEH